MERLKQAPLQGKSNGKPALLCPTLKRGEKKESELLEFPEEKSRRFRKTGKPLVKLKHQVELEVQEVFFPFHCWGKG